MSLDDLQQLKHQHDGKARQEGVALFVLVITQKYIYLQGILGVSSWLLVDLRILTVLSSWKDPSVS